MERLKYLVLFISALTINWVSEARADEPKPAPDIGGAVPPSDGYQPPPAPDIRGIRPPVERPKPKPAPDFSGIKPPVVRPNNGNDDDNKCEIGAGQGGLAVFPWSENDKERMVILEYRKVRTVFMYKGCGLKKPKVRILSGGKIEVTRFYEGNSWKDIDKGWRIAFFASDETLVGKDSVKVEVETETGHFFVFDIWVVRNAQMAAMLSAEHLRMLGRSEQDSGRALRRSERALEIARSAKSRSMANVDLVLFGMITLESPGQKAGGVGLLTNVILGKFAQDLVQLGIQGRLSWNRYQLEVIGLPPNPDAHAQEWDFSLNFLLRIRPLRWLYFDVPLGFGLRMFDHDDTANWQESTAPYRLYGVEGRVALEGIFDFGAGVFFAPHRNFIVGASWHMTVSLSRQVLNPTIEGQGDPRMGHAVNHSFVLQAGVSW